MTKAVILHNPHCSKSRETLAILHENAVQVKVVEYLKDTPDATEITHILKLLGISARELMRTKEEEYLAQGLDNPELNDEALIAAMVATPKLIERPVVIANGKAVIGRPPANVREIL